MLASTGLDSTVWIWDGLTFGEHTPWRRCAELNDQTASGSWTITRAL